MARSTKTLSRAARMATTEQRLNEAQVRAVQAVLRNCAPCTQAHTDTRCAGPSCRGRAVHPPLQGAGCQEQLAGGGGHFQSGTHSPARVTRRLAGSSRHKRGNLALWSHPCFLTRCLLPGGVVEEDTRPRVAQAPQDVRVPACVCGCCLLRRRCGPWQRKKHAFGFPFSRLCTTHCPMTEHKTHGCLGPTPRLLHLCYLFACT